MCGLAKTKSWLRRYSGSDVKIVCKEAAMRSLRRVFDQLESGADPDTLPRCVRGCVCVCVRARARDRCSVGVRELRVHRRS